MAKKFLTGVITKIGNKGEVVVSVSATLRHPRYQKVVRKTRRYLAVDRFSSPLGAKVRIMESRPLSKTKRFVVCEFSK